MATPTAEQARQELIRRGVIKPKITADEARAELARREKEFSKEKRNEFARNNLPPIEKKSVNEPISQTPILRDLGEMILGVGPELKAMASQIPQDVYYGLSEPGGITNIGEQLDYGALKTLRGLANIPSKGAAYIQSKTGVNNPVSQWNIPKTEYEKRIESNPQRGNNLWQMIGGGLPLAPVAKYSPALMGFLLAESNDANPITGTLLGHYGPKVIQKGKETLQLRKDLKRIPELESSLAESIVSEESANNVMQQLMSQSRFKSPQAAKRKAEVISEKINPLQENLEKMQAYNELIANVKPTPAPEVGSSQWSPINQVQPGAYFNKQLPPPTGEVKLQTANELMQKESQNLSEMENLAEFHTKSVEKMRENEIKTAEEEANEFFGKGKSHRNAVGEYLLEKQTGIEKEISREYQAHNANLSKYDIELTNNPELKEVRNTIKENEHFLDEKSAQEAKEVLSNEINFNVNATDINSYLKTLKTIRYNLTKDLKGRPDLEIKARRQQADTLSKQINNLEKLLKENIPEELYNGIKETNKRFSSEVIPARNSNKWKKIRDEKKFPTSNIIENINTASPGDVLMRNYILGNPDIAQLALGERLAGNPKSWGEYSEALEPYLSTVPKASEFIQKYQHANRPFESYHESHPSTKGIKERHERAQSAYENAKKIVEEAKRDSEFLSEQWKGREKELLASQKTEPVKKTEAVKKTGDIKPGKPKNTKAVEDKITKLKSELKEINDLIPQLEKAANDKKITSEEKIKRQKELEDIKKQQESLKGYLIGFLKNGLSFSAATEILKSLF